MMDPDVLEKIYLERLEEYLIAHLAKVRNVSLRKAMDIYYNSKLSEDIYKGTHNIQYLDEKILVDLLIQREPELFSEDNA